MLKLGDPARDCACFREEWDRTTEEHERFLAFVNLDILLGRWTSMIVSLTRLLFATSHYATVFSGISFTTVDFEGESFPDNFLFTGLTK